jgi:GAF domain-containing protein
MATRLVFSVLTWDCVTLLRLAPERPAPILAQQKRPDWPDPAQNKALFHGFSAREGAVYGAGLRFLADARAAPAALIGDVKADLALATLRAASTQESARAQKAGFAALLALPIRVDGETWGMLLAHDRAPRALTQDERAVLEIFADILSLSVESALWRQAAEAGRPRAS